MNGTEFRPVLVKSLREAEEFWFRVKPEAVLLDILLKGEDSWRWLSDLKSDDARKHIPVIIASAVDDKRKGIALGADDYHLKPFSKAELLSALRKALNISDYLSLETIANTNANHPHGSHTDTINEIN